jgi:uncharacterized protein (DUF924 family)
MGNPAVALQVDFLSPVVVGDRVDTAVEVERLGRSSITYRVAMTKVGGPKCFSGLLTTALVTRVHSENIKGHPFPDDWRRRIEGYRRECALRERGVKSKREVIDFWFGPPGSPERGQRREIWFAPQSGDGSDFDREIEANFLASHEAAAAGELDHWADTPDGVLALCILLDQFPRNMFRGTARAFATDAKILGIVKETVAAGLDRDVHHVPGIFLYLPFEHSEDLADQHRFRELIGRWADTPRGEDLEKYADGHREVIERFGRFPHRNAALRRTNTPEEEAYLSDPDAGF